MIFHHRQKSIVPFTNDIELDNVSIEKVEKYNFLGFSFDECMNWNNHIDKIAMKVSRTIGILCKLKHIFYLTNFMLEPYYSSSNLWNTYLGSQFESTLQTAKD